MIELLSAEEVLTAGLLRQGIYGDNGVGKSTYVASVPDTYTVLVISADEENIKMFRGKPHIKLMKLYKWDQIYEASMLLRMKAQKEPERNGKIVIAFDTWTRFQALALKKITNTSTDLDDLMMTLKTLQASPKVNWDMLERIGNLATDGARVFNRLPYHTIFLMQEDIRNPKFEGESVKVGPDLSPFALKGIKPILETIGRLYVDERRGEQSGGPISLAGLVDDAKGASAARIIDPSYQEQRMLLIGKHERYFAKGPTHLLGYVVKDPTFTNVALPIINDVASSPPVENGTTAIEGVLASV